MNTVHNAYKILFCLIVLCLTSVLPPPFAAQAAPPEQGSTQPIQWQHLSTADGDLPTPTNSSEQTVALVLDIDRDRVNDFVIGSRKAPGPAVTWYKRSANGWNRYLIEAAVFHIEAGGAYHDIDRDGDLDVVLGGSSRDNHIWWWENPYPNYSPNQGWTRREIKNNGATKHHDMIFGDFDGDSKAEFVYWNQRALSLFLAELPADPKRTQPWPATVIYRWNGGMEHEGLAQADVDGDGKQDIIGGGRWFKHSGGANYSVEVVDDNQSFSRVAVGQLKPGGRPELVFGAGDHVGPLQWYEWSGNRWVSHNLLGVDIDHGHSLTIADLNNDGHQDIFAAEMRLNGGNADAKIWVFLGNSNGNFTRTEVASGFDNHESKVADLDGDGDLDILGKPYNYRTPRLDLWLNQGVPNSCPAAQLDQWQRHVVDSKKPWRSLFITAADLNGDGRKDIVTGGWWYKNPKTIGKAWPRKNIGSPLNNLATVYDFDNDGDLDILGTEGVGSQANSNFVWARNNGRARFTILRNIQRAEGNFLQGVTVARFQPGGLLEVALAWHQENTALQLLTVPANPAQGTWTWRRTAVASQNEELNSGDIDRDGDIDLLLGTKWLQNNQPAPSANAWREFSLHPSQEPDRNHLVDMDRDGRLDAVIGFEAISKSGKLAWYQQPTTVTAPWREYQIATIIGPMSLDVVDIDRDADWDVIVGEHYPADPKRARLLIFENLDSRGGQWGQHIVHTGDEHHSGAQVFDMDNDGDLDIISIGWEHNQVLLYENRSARCKTTAPLTLFTEDTDEVETDEVDGDEVAEEVLADGVAVTAEGTMLIDENNVSEAPLTESSEPTTTDTDGLTNAAAVMDIVSFLPLIQTHNGAGEAGTLATAADESSSLTPAAISEEVTPRSYLPLILHLNHAP